MRLLTNPVRRYAWGSTEAIPHLLGVQPDGEPQAELWIGAHERASSHLAEGPLADVLAAEPERLLGPRWAAAGRLPFLAKVVAVAAPLSLQVHPDGDLAAERYRAEEEAGIDRDSARRSFPDDVAKMEMVYALSSFRALAGFRPVEELTEWLRRLDVAALRPTVDALRARGAAALLSECRRLLTAVDAADMVPQVARRCADLTGDPTWGASAGPVLEIADRYPSDPAVALALLLRPHTLRPGEVLRISPGQPHTYLSGTAFEVQANSDNVLRAGLTDKHVDVPMVLRALRTDLDGVATVAGRTVSCEQVFGPPDPAHFSLSVVAPGDAPPDASVDAKLDPPSGPQVLCCLDGRFEVADADGTLGLRRGQAAFCGADAGTVAVTGRGTLVRVVAGRAG